MNKVFVVLAGLLFAGSVYAHDFGVSATWTPESQISTAAGEAVFGDFLVGVEVDLQDIAVSVTGGFFQEVWDPEGATVFVVSRAGLPVFENETFVFGEAFLRAGFMVIPEVESFGNVSFEAGFVSDFNDISLTEFPGFYARVGLVF